MPDNVNFFRLLVGFDDNEKIAKTKKGTKAFVRTKVGGSHGCLKLVVTRRPLAVHTVVVRRVAVSMFTEHV